MITCMTCGGTGQLSNNESECCGARIKMGDICSECLEHTEPGVMDCEDCDGTGKIKEENNHPNWDLINGKSN